MINLTLFKGARLGDRVFSQTKRVSPDTGGVLGSAHRLEAI